MGDSSSACLMQQPFCYASGFPKEANKINPNHALGQSISFGKFMSESMAREKWSTFSRNNRYVEEAERFTQPGSVAQKKAFFEAHYKKLAAQKAAALLEQANSASQTHQEHEGVVDNTKNSHMTSPKSKLVLHGQNAKVCMSDATALPQSHKVEGAQAEIDHQAFGVKLQNQLYKVDNYKEPSEEGTNFDQEALPSIRKKKQPVSSFKFLKAVGISKFNSTPVKSTTPSLPNKHDIATTPMSTKPALSSANKEKSTTKSLNFTPIREINRLTVSLMRKFGSTKVCAGFSKTSKASKDELKKHPSFTPLTEAERCKRTPLIISSPINLSTKERASSRINKKLEEEFNASEAQKMRLHTKFKEKVEIKIRKLHQRFCFEAGSLPDFYNEREASKEGTKEDGLTLPESLKQGRRPTLSVIECKSSSFRNRSFQGRNCDTLTMSLNSNYPMITTHENTSPNIQHGNQNDRNYK